LANEVTDLNAIASPMNQESQLNPENSKNFFVQGNYNETISGDYIAGNYNDNSTNNKFEFKLPDTITGNANNLSLTPSNNFVGREEDLKKLHGLLEKSQTVAISAIAGMGGVGKTELVIQYALKYENEYPGSICWLRAREDIGLQIVNFAQSSFNLNIPEGLDLPTQVRYCWQHWSQENSLIILDDLPNYGQYYKENIKPYLPSRQAHFNVLITSRQQPGNNIKYLNLDILSPEAAAELIRSLAENSEIDFESDKEQLQELCKWLGYLPLGLELVGRYLDLHPSYSIEKVIKKLEGKKLQTRALQNPEEADMNAQLGVAAAFDLSWEDITEELTNKDQELANRFQEVASYLSLFKSEPFVWIFVENGLLGFEESEDREEQIEDLEELRDRYLIRRNLLKSNKNGIYQLHSLIQEYFRAKLESLEQAELLKQKFTRPMIAVAKLIPETPTQEEIKSIAFAIPHLSHVATKLIDYVEDENLIWSFVGLGRFYEGQGLYNQAEKWDKESLQTCLYRLGIEHPLVAASLNNLAKSYHLQGKYSEAEPLFQQALEMKRQLLGHTHSDVATSLNNLAALYRSQGKYSEAEPLFQQALEMSRQLSGHTHFDVAASLNNLALLYKLQGRYSEAEPLYQQALEIRRQLLGQKHPLVATSLSNLAALYLSQGRYSEAEPLFQQALEMRRKLLRQEHPDVAHSFNNLALLYKSQGRYSEAEPLSLEALELMRKLLGQKHPLVATSLNNLAALFELQGKYSEAETLYQQALEMMRKLLGQEHPDVATSLNNLAALYRSQGKYSEAEPLFQKALEIAEKTLGKNHPNTNTIRANFQYLFMMKLFQMPEEKVKQMFSPEVFEQLLQIKQQYQSEAEATTKEEP